MTLHSYTKVKTGYCMEHNKHYPNMKKHLNTQKHRCKLYNPKYEKLCHYKNCIEFWTVDGYCKKHLPRILHS